MGSRVVDSPTVQKQEVLGLGFEIKELRGVGMSARCGSAQSAVCCACFVLALVGCGLGNVALGGAVCLVM
jgi:hypothetical protein